MGGKGGRRQKMRTVKEEERQLAEERLAQIAEKHPESSIGRQIAERDQLREALNEHALGSKTHLGDVTETTPGKPRRVHLREQRAQRAGGKLVGAEDFQGGKVRIPYTATAQRPRSPTGSYRGGKPKAPPSTTHEFKGELLRTGNFRDKTTQLVAESGLEAERYASVLRRRDKILKAARDTKPNKDGWVPVKTGEVSKVSPRLQQLANKAEEGVKLSGAERRDLAQGFEDWRNTLFPDERALPEEELAGVKWVRKELLDKLNPAASPFATVGTGARVAGKVLTEINSAAKAAMLYLAPKYAVPNLLGNVAMNILHQGFAAPKNLARAATLAASAGRDVAAMVDAMMGEGFAGSFAGDLKAGPATAVAGKLASAWGKVVDVPSRRAAFLHEASEAGYKSGEELRALLNDESKRPDLVEVTQRARDAIGDYERLGTNEKAIVRHVVFFYPWLKVSTRYTGHLVGEHPVKAATIAELGQQGEQQQEKDLGRVPSFAEGIFKTGEHNYAGIGNLPVVRNPSSANIFTSADIAKTIGNFLHGRRSQSGDQLTGMLTPGLSLALTELTGRDPFTQAPVKGNALDVAKEQLTGSLPQTLLKQRLERAKGDQSDKLYVYTPGQAKGQFYLGPLGERGYNLDAAKEIVRKEDLADAPPVKRSYATVFDRRNRFYKEAKRLNMLHDGRLPEPLREAFNYEAERQGSYTAATKSEKRGTVGWQRARFQVDVRFLAKYGGIDKTKAREALTWASRTDDIDAIKHQRSLISERYYQIDGGFLDTINKGKKQLEERGAKDLG